MSGVEAEADESATDDDGSTIDVRTVVGLDALTPVPDSADQRERDGRTENMVVLPVVDQYDHCTGEYLVYSESGSSYDVTMDSRETCDCLDMTFNSPSSGCKHIQRVGNQIAEGDLPAPDQPGADFMDRLRDAREDLAARLEDDGLDDAERDLILRTINALAELDNEEAGE